MNMKYSGALLIGIVLSLAGSLVAQSTRALVTVESIKAEMQLNVCKNKERLEAVKSLFKKMGAADEEIKIEKRDNVENLIVSKKGKTEETVIVGAHYDIVQVGCGAIDNWSGVVILANLFKTFRSIPTNKTILFVAFGKEEKGLVGSEAMAKSIPKEKRALFCAMINFDSFGLYYPQVLSNSSSSTMTDFATELAMEVKMPFHQASLAGVANADSTSFLRTDIPAITFHGLSSAWQDYIHSSRDKLENVNYQSVLVGYNFGALYLARVDAKPCNAFRK